MNNLFMSQLNTKTKLLSKEIKIDPNSLKPKIKRYKELIIIIILICKYKFNIK
jgi:hypothetical protein